MVIKFNHAAIKFTHLIKLWVKKQCCHIAYSDLFSICSSACLSARKISLWAVSAGSLF